MRSVTIIGAGPAGLTAARVLHAHGLRDVLVLERNPLAGGLPRFADHLGWGMLDMHRILRGPSYARRLVEAAEEIEIRTNSSVVRLHPGGVIEANGRNGTECLHSRVVLLATGIRERPRSARLISGSRPWGVVSTGAFQEMVYRGRQRPFRRPVVVGSELVSFSALMTAKHAGITPVAMIEAGERIVAYRLSEFVARAIYGVPVRKRTRLVRIVGTERVTGVIVECDGREEPIACDGVILSGQFVPEASLLRDAGLEIDPATGGPAIDNMWRCSDPAYFAAGNLLRPVEHSGAVALEGRAAAEAILKALAGLLPERRSAIAVRTGAGVRYVYPQRVLPSEYPVTLFGRVDRKVFGTLVVRAQSRVVLEKQVRLLPERRLTIRLPGGACAAGADLSVDIV